MSKVIGQCYCGKIKYQVSASPTLFQHCHCHQCQVIHGAPFVSWVGFKTDACHIEDDEKISRVFNTGKAARCFCGNCGSTYCFTYTFLPESWDAESKALFKSLTYFAATTIRQNPYKLDDKINPAFMQTEYHIYSQNQPEWTRSFVHLP
jgi:hypothetical protein